MSGGSTARAHSLPRRRNRSSACRGEKPPLGGRERNWGALKVKMGGGEDIGGKNNKAGKQENEQYLKETGMRERRRNQELLIHKGRG